MNLGVYTFNKEGVVSIFKHIKSSILLRLFGIPKVKGGNLKEIAKEIIKENAKEWGIQSGKSHFVYTWTVDFAKAFNGAAKVLPKNYLKKQIQRIIDASFQKRHVPTCFAKNHSFDMPFPRHDNLPWLLYVIDQYVKKFNEKQFLQENKPKVEKIYKDFMAKYFDYKTNLIKKISKFDWMDSITRPSSTYSNLCLLQMFNSAKNLKLKVQTFKKEAEKSLMKRWFGNYFEDYEKSGKYLSADANVPVLYFNLFDKKMRRKIRNKLESSDLLFPAPMRLREGKYTKNLPFLTRFAGGYHNVIWPHIGLMYLNGLKRNGFEYKKHLKRLENVYQKHKNMLEILDLESKPFKSPILVTEYNFTMVSGQYLELVE